MPGEGYHNRWDYSSSPGRSVSYREGWKSRERRGWERKQRKRGKHTMLGLVFRGGRKYRGK